MKNKLVYLAWSLAVLIATFCGCNANYMPEAEYYFKTGEVYRVLELADETPEHRKDFGLEAYLTPFNENILYGTATFTIEGSFTENSLLFDRYAMLSRQGVETIYDYLNIESAELSDELYVCVGRGFYSYNTQIKYGASKFEIQLEGYGRYDTIGIIADVDIYTFNYTDLSVKDGKKVKEGSFKVYVVTGNVYVGRFSLEEI